MGDAGMVHGRCLGYNVPYVIGRRDEPRSQWSRFVPRRSNLTTRGYLQDSHEAIGRWSPSDRSRQRFDKGSHSKLLTGHYDGRSGLNTQFFPTWTIGRGAEFVNHLDWKSAYRIGPTAKTLLPSGALSLAGRQESTV